MMIAIFSILLRWVLTYIFPRFCDSPFVQQHHAWSMDVLFRFLLWVRGPEYLRRKHVSLAGVDWRICWVYGGPTKGKEIKSLAGRKRQENTFESSVFCLPFTTPVAQLRSVRGQESWQCWGTKRKKSGGVDKSHLKQLPLYFLIFHCTQPLIVLYWKAVLLNSFLTLILPELSSIPRTLYQELPELSMEVSQLSIVKLHLPEKVQAIVVHPPLEHGCIGLIIVGSLVFLRSTCYCMQV